MALQAGCKSVSRPKVREPSLRREVMLKNSPHLSREKLRLAQQSMVQSNNTQYTPAQCNILLPSSNTQSGVYNCRRRSIQYDTQPQGGQTTLTNSKQLNGGHTGYTSYKHQIVGSTKHAVHMELVPMVRQSVMEVEDIEQYRGRHSQQSDMCEISAIAMTTMWSNDSMMDSFSPLTSTMLPQESDNESSMDVMLGTISRHENTRLAIDPPSYLANCNYKNLGVRPPCVGKEPSPMKYREGTKPTALPNVTRKDTTYNFSNTSKVLIVDLATNSDCSAFMEQPMCKKTIVSDNNKKSKRKSLSHKLKQIGRQLQGRGKTDMQTLAVL